MVKRVNITIDEELDKKMLVFMAKYHMSKSALIAVSVSQYMDAMEALPGLKTQLDDLKKALDDLAVVK